MIRYQVLVTTMMAPSSLFLLVLSSSVLSVMGQNSTGLSFTGPGYIACPIAEYQSNVCEFDFDDNCTTAQFQVCNATTPQEATTDASFQTAYFPLHCECVIATGCSDSCEFFDDDLPTLPPVTGFVNFTGIGDVTCPVADLLITQVPCEPTVEDTASCGTCDTTIVDDTFGYTVGDETVTYPLPCECFVLINCPNTCTFEATDGPVDVPVAAPTSVEAPVAAPTSVEAPVDTSNVASPSKDDAPAAPTTDKEPVAAPASVPTRPVSSPSAPVRSPNAAPSTSSSVVPSMNGYNTFAFLTIVSFLVL